MKRTLRLKYLCMMCIGMMVLCSFPHRLLAEAPTVGTQLPAFTLPAPDSEQSQAYLGLKSMGPFSLSAVKAKLILFEFLTAT